MTWEMHLKMIPLIRQILLRYLCSLTHACSVAYLMVAEQACTMCMEAISSARNLCNGTCAWRCPLTYSGASKVLGQSRNFPP